MSEFNDAKLREAFDALSHVAPAGAPSFASLTSPRAIQNWKRTRRRRSVALIVIALLLPTALIVRASRARGPDFERFTALTGLDPGQVTWRAPSDFLLDIPGRDLLRTIPWTGVLSPTLPSDSPRADSSVTPRRSSDS